MIRLNPPRDFVSVTNDSPAGGVIGRIVWENARVAWQFVFSGALSRHATAGRLFLKQPVTAWRVVTRRSLAKRHPCPSNLISLAKHECIPMTTGIHVRVLAVLTLACLISLADSPLAADEPAKGESAKRVPWTTSRFQGTPDPPHPYTTERAFPALKFNMCLDLVAMPGSDRLFVIEQGGKIFSFPNRQGVEKADLAIDVAKAIPGVEQTYSLAFHPDFVRNRYCYVCYIKAANLPDGTHVARFRVADTDPPTLEPDSEKTLITWLSGGHNGCCLKFGPDGYLYISTGDGAGPNPPDTLRTGQSVDDLLSAILRIDVDHEDADKAYRIPADNPFVNLAGARGEIWAYGFRNPWRMSFDRKTGDLWVGDVGWEMWELLDRVERGGNYGWSVLEGRQATNPEWERGPTPILPPTIDHSHTESSSITDGLTYYGKRLPELSGMHLYSDYDTGKFWGFRYQEGRVVGLKELADTTHRVVGFGEDASGEFYILDHTAGTIHSLIPNPERNQNSTFPRTLSASGLYSSVADQKLAAGVIPYSLNAEPWADYAIAERCVAVPGELSIKTEKTESPIWQFPKDSVLAKTLSLELRQGDPTSRRRIETQVLHFDGTEWQTYAYQWNDEQTDATLVEAAGAERTIDVVDADAVGGTRRQTWRFASRAECQRCHNKWSGPVLAFHTPQLNRPASNARSQNPSGPGSGISNSQLDTFASIGLFEKPVPGENLPRLADPHDSSADLDARARAYLQVNCAHCHRMHAGGAVLSKMHYDLPLDKTDMVGARPMQGTFGIHGAHVITPGDPFRSVLYYRMSKLGGGRMPHIGSTEVDQDGLALIGDWVAQLAREKSSETSTRDAAAQPRLAEATALDRLKGTSLPAERKQLVEQLLTSTSGALRLLQSIDRRALSGETRTIAIETGTRHDDVGIRDLFERFLPPEKRVKRLGSSVRPDQILSLTGNSDSGRKLFFETAGVQCKTCHRIRNEGQEIGPDLTTIGKKLDRAQLLESLLDPSRRIDPQYVTYLVETVDGKLSTGLLVKKDEELVVLKDAQNREVRIPTKQIEQLVPQRESLMPELLFRDMTAQQLADLLEFLGSQK